jgi:hypothetical protein
MTPTAVQLTFMDSTMIWTEEDIQAVWCRGEIVEGFKPDKWRKDACGAWMSRDRYGNQDSVFGWEIDHVTPIEHRGIDDLTNLRPLQWKNLATKQDGQLTCPVKAFGGGNLELG